MTITTEAASRLREGSRDPLSSRAPTQGKKSFLRDNGLSLVLGACFAIFLAGQSFAGHRSFNEDRIAHGERPIAWSEYLRSSHFAEATFENWESEFLQMAAYVLLTAFLFQRGSAESRDPDEPASSSSTEVRDDASRPWPVKRGGIALRLYENSLGLAFGLIFLATFLLHAWSGARLHNEEALLHGEAPLSTLEFVATSQFWFESLQNWQSEFLAILAMVGLSIFLRQKDSPESKDVASPHAQTGA
jgi:hypothetical protein